AMALDTLGDHRRALHLLADMQHLREDDGSYWTGWVYEGDNPDVYWPVEHTTYTAAAVILAVDALGETHGHSTAGSGIMRGTSLAPHFRELMLECDCASSDEVASFSSRSS
ncbi:MAG: prenyltransferase, partial [Actinomycetota bacterium]|nr:prenyltransferase [Actinomycetota bacterium]